MDIAELGKIIFFLEKTKRNKKDYVDATFFLRNTRKLFYIPQAKNTLKMLT